MQLSWRTKQLNAVDLDAIPEADDDASMYHLFGFALHVGMKFMKRPHMVIFACAFAPVERDNMQWNCLF